MSQFQIDPSKGADTIAEFNRLFLGFSITPPTVGSQAQIGNCAAATAVEGGQTLFDQFMRRAESVPFSAGVRDQTEDMRPLALDAWFDQSGNPQCYRSENGRVVAAAVGRKLSGLHHCVLAMCCALGAVLVFAFIVVVTGKNGHVDPPSVSRPSGAREDFQGRSTTSVYVTAAVDPSPRGVSVESAPKRPSGRPPGRVLSGPSRQTPFRALRAWDSSSLTVMHQSGGADKVPVLPDPPTVDVPPVPETFFIVDGRAYPRPPETKKKGLLPRLRNVVFGGRHHDGGY